MKLTTETTLDIRAIVRWPRAEGAFPRYPADELKDLAMFAKANGTRSLPRLIVAPDFRLVDGYNRLDAFESAGLTQADVEVWSYSSDEEMFRHSILLNAKRRHLDNIIRAEKAAEYSESLEIEAAERANRARAEAARNQPRTEDGKRLASGQAVITVAPGGPRHPNTLETAARQLGVSDKTVRQVVKVKETGDATLIDAMRDHTLPVAKAAALAAQPPEVRAAVIQAARSSADGMQSVADAMKRVGCEHFIAGCVDAMQSLEAGGKKTPWDNLTEDETGKCLNALGGVLREAQKWHDKAKEARDGKVD